MKHDSKDEFSHSHQEIQLSGTSTEYQGSNEPAFSDDLLRGAAEIAAWLYGDPKFRRRVYYIVERSKYKFPHFKIGSQIHAQKSVLRAHFNEQSNRR
jgi:hypothetical protein